MTIAIGVIVVLSGAALAAVALLLFHADRMIKVRPAQLAALACPLCGVAIGLDAANLIAERHHEDVQRRLEDARRRGIILRLSPYWRFDCPACGAALKFDPDARGPQLTPDDATSRTSARPGPP